MSKAANVEELLLVDDVDGDTPLPVARVKSAVQEPETRSENAEYEEEVPARRGGWIAPTLAIVAVIGWFGGMGWLLRDSFAAPMPPVALVQLIAALCVPPVLIGILYLLLLRTSTAEARRFGTTARAMRAESEALERKMAALAARLEASRAELVRQSSSMVTMGENAAERLDAVATTVGKQAATLAEGTRALADTASDAERRVSIVLSSLPKAGEEMRDLSEKLDAAGIAASQRAAALEAQLAGLAERGREADAVAGGSAEKLAAHIARMEATSETASRRLEQVTGEMSTEVDAVLDRAAQAVDEARKGIAAQGEAMLAMLSANQAALDKAGRENAEALGAKIDGIEEAVGRIGERLDAEQKRGETLFHSLSDGASRFDREMSVVHAAGMDRTQALTAQLSALGESFEAMRGSMESGEASARKVIGTSEDLLTALDAAAREIDETLPEALDRLDVRIEESRKVVAASKPELLALVTAAESTHDAIEAIADVVQQQRDTLAKTQESLLETLASGRAKADAIESIVDDAIATTRRFAEEAAPQLVDALLRVRETSNAAAEHARTTLAGIVPQATGAIEQATGDALKRAIEASVQREMKALADSSEAAIAAANRASERLTQQMLKLAETTAAVEAQIDEARAEEEERGGDNFGRRVSLLIEAMNSASIDITKSFSVEVADSAWSAYLKGDRGVFTRRAVRLLDSGEAREIARLYGDDEEFRDQVNRYIHDFEAMLRQILALRDGSPLGVTLLSSDMGKLYVALAQAIERLRA